MSERIISEKIISSKKLGSSNPILRKFRNFKSSCAGLVAAPILILISLGVLFYGEKFEKSSKVVEDLDLISASEAEDKKGMQKFNGKIKITDPIENDYIQGAVYISYKSQEYREVEKKETVTETVNIGGDDVEQTKEITKIFDEWVDIDTKIQWAEFKVGDISIDPNEADLQFDFDSKKFYLSKEDQYYYDEYEEVSTSPVPVIGDKRLVFDYVSSEDELVIVGEISNGKVKDGEVFIISNKSASALLQDLKSSESAMYWGLKFLSWLLMTIGFLSILGPILSIADFIPIAGKAASCVGSIVAGVLSLIIVTLLTLLIKLWWLCLGGFILIFIGLSVLLVVLIVKKKE